MSRHVAVGGLIVFGTTISLFAKIGASSVDEETTRRRTGKEGQGEGEKKQERKRDRRVASPSSPGDAQRARGTALCPYSWPRATLAYRLGPSCLLRRAPAAAAAAPRVSLLRSPPARPRLLRRPAPQIPPPPKKNTTVYELEAPGADGKPKLFQKPWAMTTLMFVGA